MYIMFAVSRNVKYYSFFKCQINEIIADQCLDLTLEIEPEQYNVNYVFIENKDYENSYISCIVQPAVRSES